MDDARALAGRLRRRADHALKDHTFVCYNYAVTDATLDREIADYLDRLAAPEGVGLTRYELVHRPTRTTMEPSERGNYVRHQDAAAVIAGLEARLAEAERRAFSEKESAWAAHFASAQANTRAEAAERALAEATKRIEVAIEALEIIAQKRQCLDNLMGNRDVAEAALALLSPASEGK